MVGFAGQFYYSAVAILNSHNWRCMLANTANKQILIAHASHGLRRQPAARLSALNLGVSLYEKKS